MTTIILDWRLLLFILVGSCIGVLGSLYLAYDLFGRSEKLYRWVWVFSSGFLFASLLLASYIFFVGPDHLSAGYLSKEVWRFVALLSSIAFMMQAVSFSSVPLVRFPGVDWSRLIFWMVLYCLGFVGTAVVMAPQGTSPITVAIFALPGTLIYGVLNGFSPAIHWWVLHLPEKRVAAIGALLICCAFVFMSVLPLLNLLGIPF